MVVTVCRASGLKERKRMSVMLLQKQRQKQDLTEGAIMPKLILFCIPILLSGMLQLLYNSADMIVVGQFSSDTAMGAVGASGSLINLMVNLFIGLSVGTSVTVAQYIGSRQYDQVRAVVHTSVALSALMGVFVGLFGFAFAEQALLMMKTPETTLAEALPYVRAYMTGVPALMIYNYCAAVLRAKGDSTRPLVFLAVSGLLNVLMNLLMVVGLGLGAVGVGIATSFSQYAALTMILVHMTRLRDDCRIEWRHIRIHRAKLVEILRIGLPAGIQSVLFSISNVMIQSSVNSFGDAVIDGNAAAANIDGFIWNAQNSVYQGAITFAGQHVGAKKYKRLSRVVVNCMVLVTVIGFLFGGAVILFAKPLLTVYAPDMTATALEWGRQRLNLMGATYFLCGLMDVAVGILRGMGRTLTPMVVSLAGVCGIRIMWVLLVFRAFPTMTCLYLSYPVTWLITGAVQYTLLFVCKRQMERAEAAQTVE